MTQTERDENLMIVVAVEGYAHKHDISPRDALALFMQHGVNRLIRRNYGALHTQSFDEPLLFAEDVMTRKLK
ncbi:MAG: DUF3791 domain-containing protein [Chitinispirillales bacterium]|jgi:hypothetical protein|nr:DUF3791 domain-containing protein [Chitinispirillales bacterium]